jgi:hypothetical protein
MRRLLLFAALVVGGVATARVLIDHGWIWAIAAWLLAALCLTIADRATQERKP